MSMDIEPFVWKYLMAQVRPDDVVADVGAYLGYWTVGFAKRLGKNGRVFSFEPDPKNFRALTSLVALNNVKRRVTLFNTPLDAKQCVRYFNCGNNDLCKIDIFKSVGDINVKTDTLDNIFKKQYVDIIKIDVEGFEESVLRGGRGLLLDERRAPRLMCIEVHPHFWQKCHYGTTSVSLLGLLKEYGYKVISLSGKGVENIVDYGHIIASKDAMRNQG